MIHKSYRYRIYPTEVQAQQLVRHFGAVRFVYNWGLETKERAWRESKERVSWIDLSAQLTILKKEKDWLCLPSRSALVQAIHSLENAYQRFFNLGQGSPKFKTRASKQSLSFSSEAFHHPPLKFDTEQIFIPKIGLIKCTISQRFDGKIKGVNVTKTKTGKYFASCLVELEADSITKTPPAESEAVGVDLGLKQFAVLSSGERIANPRNLNKGIAAIRRAQRRFSKKKKGGKNREKYRLRFARLHEKVSNRRKDFLHKVTTKLIRENQTVCIEDLSVSGMVKNPKLARHISDASWGEFRVLLQYKADWYGKNVLIIDRFAPSSKQCSCGHKNETLTLKDRSWTCEACNVTHDRDLLAAQNIVRFAFHPELAVKRSIGRGTSESTPVETLAIAGR